LPLAAALLAASGAARAGDPDPRGLWRTEKGNAVVRLAECADGGGELCGRVWWLEPGGLRFDWENPDKDKRGQPLCGLEVMWGFERDGPREWDDGKLYKVDDGEIYDAFFKLKGNGKLKVSGFVGFHFLSKSQKWTRVSAQSYPQCTRPPQPPAIGAASPFDDAE